MIVSSDVNKFLNNVGNIKTRSPASEKSANSEKPENGGKDSKSFGDVLRQTYALKNLSSLNEINKTVQGITFSKHAMQRLAQRDIKIDDGLISKIDGALKKAAGKNIKNVLLISDDTAFIVSVDNNVVVTAMNVEEMKENVITKIDGTVII
ncbi:MAG: flagellar protein [Oscillospiraceae bacterium]|nr:flagellar protein [Oscillospiraceae bacterium]